MHVLVTGGAGYIGAVTVEVLLAAGHEVTVLDDLSTGHARAVPDGARLIRGSYADGALLRRLLEEAPVDAVLHCGARAIVPESIRLPDLYYRENVAGGVTLLEALRHAGVRRFVLSSTAAVYGVPARTPISEDAGLDPINPYGETKRVLEGALAAYVRAHGLRAVVLRYFNAAGASRARGELHDPETHLIPIVLGEAARGGEVTVYGDDYPTPDGTCVRDYIHVLDIADAHVRALEATAPGSALGPPGPTGGTLAVCNLGIGRGFSVREVVEAAERVVGMPIRVRVGERRPGDPPTLVASAVRAGSLLGWQPQRRQIDEIVHSAWEWRRRHPRGYEQAES